MEKRVQTRHAANACHPVTQLEQGAGLSLTASPISADTDLTQRKQACEQSPGYVCTYFAVCKISSVQHVVHVSNCLQDEGFSEAIIDRFFRPFLGGIFFDRGLSTSSRLFEFVMRCLATGSNCLPAQGIGAVADQLASKLPEGSIRTGQPRMLPGSKRVLPSRCCSSRATMALCLMSVCVLVHPPYTPPRAC